jgi:lysine-ketoglutarate reductase/saccharopine dehydrogenase-like protein (TIGR00300 family)
VAKVAKPSHRCVQASTNKLIVKDSEKVAMLDDITYHPPDFSAAHFAAAPDALLLDAPAKGILPSSFYSTTNYPTYVKHQGKWVLVERQRMDAAIVYDRRTGIFECLEMRRVQKGRLVVVAAAEDGSTGVLIHADGFRSAGVPSEAHDAFGFMVGEYGREHPVDFSALAQLIRAHRNRVGYSIWVLGPAVVHSGHSGARDAMSWLIAHGYVSVIFGGNAVATHDLECALFGTTLGMDHSGRSVLGGHRHHMDAINRIRTAGSIPAAVDAKIVSNGIMHSAVTSGIPYVLAGSIRDDGPLPDVITDALRAQDEMRMYTERATLVVMLATMLHSIATGNMMPTFVVREGILRPVYTIAVDQSEHMISKLIDRGTHQAMGIVRNADDFLVRLKLELDTLERETRELAQVEVSHASG